MGMARLIDPDKLFRAIRDDAEISGKTYARVKEHIFNAEDEVVRCKVCKHWLKDVPGCTEQIGRCEWANYMVGAVGYCVYGERRTDERKAD